MLRNPQSPNCTTTLERLDPADVRRVCVAADPRLAVMFDAFDGINARVFEGKLPPHPLVIGLTPYGRCVGLNYSRFILLGQYLWEGGAYHTGLSGRVCVLLHEMMHSRVRIVGKGKGPSSHDCDGWAAECNRIAPLIGLDGHAFSRRKSTRWNGKPVKAIPEGCVSLCEMSRFPRSLFPLKLLALEELPEWAR